MNVTEIDSGVSALQNISKELSESNSTDFTLTLISIIISGILAGVVIIQLLIYRNEVNSRMRPWIGRQNIERSIDLRPKNGNKSPRILFYFINNGELPALNVTTSASFGFLIKPDEEPPFEHDKPVYALAPKETWVFRVEIPDEGYTKAMTTSEFYFAAQVKYTDKNGISGLYEVRGHYEKGLDVFDDVRIT